MDTYKISCKNIPDIFFEEKNVAKDHFRQFGRIKKMIFKPKSRMCTVEYASKESAQKATDLGCVYGNHIFEITKEIPLIKARNMKNHDQEWLQDQDVLEELNAMGGGPSSELTKIYNMRTESGKLTDTDFKENNKKVSKRQWSSLEVKNTPTKFKPALPFFSVSEEQQELIDLIKKPANSIDDKYKILDARDKLIRFLLKRKGQKTGATKGTCPDMCPEKERLLRVIQHQVSIYEQDFSKEMNEALAVKQYSRSSADQEAPLPHELRSVNVLQMTMSYLIHKIMNLGDTPDVNIGDWYHFLWDRTRSIRKDITQQELCSQGSVTLVEQCARFHIHCSARMVAEEPSVFDQKINTENLTKCLQTLKYMYNDLRLKGEDCPNEAEFRAYIILLNLNDANFMWEVQKLQTKIKKSQEVKAAIEIYSALDKNNFIKFFKLVKRCSYLNACILMRYFMQVRIRAITILLKCYTPRITKVIYPLDKLTANLAFESISHTMEFLQSCGLTINSSRTGVILDKNMFTTPDFTYAPLDRSINIVECKRNNFSVGQVVCQGNLPPTDFEYHIPQNSFKDGNILNLELTQELKKLLFMEKLPYKVVNKMDREKNSLQATYKSGRPKNPYVYVKDTQKSTHSKFEEKQSIQPTLPIIPIGTSSIFSLDNRGKTENSVTYRTNIFGSLKNLPPPDCQEQEKISKDVNLFTEKNQKSIQVNPVNTFKDTSKNDTNVFGTSVKSTKSLFGGNNLFDGASVISQRSIFGEVNQTKDIQDNKLSIFGNKNAVYINQQNKIEVTDIASNELLKNENDFNDIKWDLDSPQKCDNPQNNLEDIFFKSSGSKTTKLIKNFIPKSVGSFSFPKFSFEQMDADKISKTNTVGVESLSKKAEIGIQLEKGIEEGVAKENVRLQTIIIEPEQKRKEDEAKRKLQDAELIQILNKKKFEEIKATVEKLIPQMLDKVEEIIKMEKIEEIQKKLHRRILSETFKIWRNRVLKIKRKRKAIACSPLWTCTRTPHEEASELKMESQNLALQNIKRYKYGKPLLLSCDDNKIVKKIDFKNLADIIFKRYCKLGFKLVKEVFWKCIISLPSISEMPEGWEIIDEALQRSIEWQKSNGDTILLKEFSLNASQSAKFCIKRQSDGLISQCDSNGLIFIAKNYNQALCKRILENIKDFGVFVRVPVVIIMQEKPPNSMNLTSLVEEGIISNYLILVDNLNPEKLVSNVEISLSFLLKNVEAPPALELDTMKSFLIKNLCSEIWRKAKSFCKWNSAYKNCLKNPNVAVYLYNEAIARLRNIILDKRCYELAKFPRVFKELLPSQIPDSLPCDYKYFPEFCKEGSYLNSLSNILNDMELKPFKSWPPENEVELETLCLEYVSQSFKDLQKPFYKMLSVFSNYIESSSFDEIRHVVWTDIIEILALEKINECRFYLEGTEYFNKSVFNQFIVIYNPEFLKQYCESNWFYVNNSIIRNKIVEKEYIPWEENKINNYDMNKEEIDNLISKAESKIQNYDHTSKKTEMNELKNLLIDFEESLLINKRINESLNEKLMSIIKET